MLETMARLWDEAWWAVLLIVAAGAVTAWALRPKKPPFYRR